MPQASFNRLQNTGYVIKHVVIPEPEHVEVGTLQVGVASSVTCDLLAMLTTIQLDNQPALQAYEVDDIWADWTLAAELEAHELPRPKPAPQISLNVCRSLA